MLSKLLLSLFTFGAQSPISVADPVVALNYSSYRGVTHSNGVTEWLGIRYAAPPTGALRWKAPEVPPKHTGIIDADAHAPVCLPTPGGIPNATHSEDCLFLDIYAPTRPLSAKLPVYVFIQGGGFNSNSNANYNGSGLIQASNMSIIVVNFNYRVGLYGFLASEEVVANGDVNVGLLDQRMVLRWVQTYIAKFGGDPDHVVLGGDSAGAASVMYHLTAYGGNSSGLFHAAAAESTSFGPMLNVSQSQYQYEYIIEQVGCRQSNATNSLECLRNIDASSLQKHNKNIPYPSLGPQASAPIFMYGPIIDGILIQDYSFRMIQQGKFIKVPVIFGADTNDGTDFTLPQTANYSQMDEFMREQFPALTKPQLSHLNSLYNSTETFPGKGKFWRTVSDAYGEMRYMCPSQALGSAFDQYSPEGAWIYRYNVEDQWDMTCGYGVRHTAEVSAIWGPYNIPRGAGVPRSLWPGKPNAPIIPVMQAYWSSFIRSFDPNTHKLPGSPGWEKWDRAEKNRLMIQTNRTGMELVDQGQQQRCAWLAGIAVDAEQ